MDETIDIDGIPTRVRRVGAGPEVLVLHGWGARIEAMHPMIVALQSSLTVVAPDLPGFGETAPPPRPWGVADYGEWTRALIETLGLRRPAIVGHSHGGRAAIHLAAHHPELVGRLILVDSAGIRPRRTLRYRRKVAVAKLAKHVLRRLGPPGRALARRLVARSASADYAAAGAMRPTMVKLVNEDISELLPRIQSPTLLVWGSEDSDTPLADGETMERLIPDAGLVVLEGAGHFSYLDQPGRFARVATHFLAPPVTVS